MPVFSTTVPDERLVTLTKNKYRRVLIVACPGCINESLAFVSGLAIEHIESKKISYPAVEQECNRIRKVLQTIDVESEIMVFPSGTNSRCIIDLSRSEYLLPPTSKYDAILLLSCPSAFPSIKRQTGLPVHIITKQIGMVRYSYTDSEAGRCIIEGKVHRFNNIELL